MLPTRLYSPSALHMPISHGCCLAYHTNRIKIKVTVVFHQVGLCMHLRELPWFQQAKSDSFFPRCYRLSHVEDRQAFVGETTLKCTSAHTELLMFFVKVIRDASHRIP